MSRHQIKSQPTVKSLTARNYKSLLEGIINRVRSAQHAALKVVNKEYISLYWDIGQIIVERQQVEGWGKSVVQKLADDLGASFPGISGFSTSNLWRMKLFYETYSTKKKLAPLVREISWSHNLLIMERCKDDLQREFYLRMTRRMGWSKNVLIHQIENQTYEKTLLNQTNFDHTITPAIRAQAKLAVKDEYIFDFLELGEKHAERELERALIGRIEDFLRAMGGLFAFVGSQFRLEVEGKEYFLDLLLYHRQLKSLVVIDLKVSEFEPEFVGKMQFYLAALDNKIKLPGENASIGIILCKSKHRTIVEYALHDSTKPIGVAAYRIFSHLPKEYKGQLPEPAHIAQLLQDIE